MKKFDVAIIGGGAIGTSIAFELSSQKLRVAVFDRQQPGQEASWAAAGMLSPAPDSLRDHPLVPLGNESLKLYPDFAARVEEASGRVVGYARDGAIEVFLDPDVQGERDRRVSECRRLGVAAEPVSLTEARRREQLIGPSARAACWLPEEGTVEPRSLMAALLEAARRAGAEIHASCAVTGLIRDRDRCTGLVAGGEKVAADFVVVAAGCFSGEMTGELGALAQYAPTRPVRGQMLALRPEGYNLRHVLRSDRANLVPRKDGRIVVGSTSEEAGFDKRVTPAGLCKILSGALEMCPGLAGAEVIETWCGLRPGTPDDLPVLGPTDLQGLIVATGHYRNGILLAPVTAKLVREWIVDGGTEFDARAFSPLRFSQREIKSMSRGN